MPFYVFISGLLTIRCVFSKEWVFLSHTKRCSGTVCRKTGHEFLQQQHIPKRDRHAGSWKSKKRQEVTQETPSSTLAVAFHSFLCCAAHGTHRALRSHLSCLTTNGSQRNCPSMCQVASSCRPTGRYAKVEESWELKIGKSEEIPKWHQSEKSLIGHLKGGESDVALWETTRTTPHEASAQRLQRCR